MMDIVKTSSLEELMRSRRSCRSFTSRGIPRETVARIIDMATLAPSGAGEPCVAFAAICREDLKKRLRALCEGIELDYYSKVKEDLKQKFEKMGLSHEKPFLTEAPWVVVACSVAGHPYSLQGTWLSIAYFLLATRSFGLDTLTYTPSPTHQVAEMLGLPERWKVECILPLGYMSEKRKLKKKIYPEEQVLWME